MNRILLTLIALVLWIPASLSQTSLMPAPVSVAAKEGKFRITPDLCADYAKGDPTLASAVDRFFQLLNLQTRTFFNRESFLPAPTAQLVIVSGKTEAPLPGVDESYELEVMPSGIRLVAKTSIGALRGLETLLQLAASDTTGFYFPAVSIQDHPSFPWRGLMIDVARHFIPMEVLKRNVDAMSAVKLNVLHLHLTDDEGFRMESRAFPKLHQEGSNGRYYTQVELKDLVRYAAERGIAVIPEFDLPGHCRSWLAGYPELASTPGKYTPGPRFNADGKSLGEMMAMINTTATPSIDPTKESVYKFLETLAGEVRSVFPYAYFHIGADENNGVAWKQNPSITAFMQKNRIPDVKALEHYFVMRVHAIVQKKGMRLIVWEEAFNKDLPADVIVQKWKPELALMGTPLSAATVLGQGNDLIISTGFYLDHHMPAYIHHRNPLFQASKSVENMKGRLLGGEAAQWSEIADGNTIETRMWMNTAAIADRLWSPPGQSDTRDLYARLFSLSRLLDIRGLRHIDQYEKGLRALAGDLPVQEARQLADVLVPIRGYKRLFGRMTKPQGEKLPNAPLNGIADILPMNSEVKWSFRNEVEQYLSDPSGPEAGRIRKRLMAWMQVKDMIWGPGLKPVKPHADNLSSLASAALESMDRRSQGQWSAEWAASKDEVVRKAAAIHAETQLDLVSELQALITGKLLPLPTSYPLF